MRPALRRSTIATADPSSQKGLWWQEFNACRRQLNRQREPIQAGTDLSDGRGVRIAHLESGPHCLGTLDEEGHRLILGERHEIGQVFGIGHGERRDGKLLRSPDERGQLDGEILGVALEGLDRGEIGRQTRNDQLVK